MSGTLVRIIEEVKALSPEERRELEVVLRDLDSHPARPLSEEQLLQKMAADGRVTLPSRPLQRVTPVPCTGKPVSEIIIEERR
jgi:hypothetical protein